MRELTIGSLFDGIGGFPLAAEKYGIKAVWASEIEPFPIEITKRRFPDMKHYGDITLIDGGMVEPVDVITGGSPCQDLSVAGRRAGLDGARSGLFMEQVRIIKEARLTHGGRPRFMVWENVPGAFSSNKGEDFRAILEEIARIAEDGVTIPRPAGGRWATAGKILGDGWSIAWRVLDAQYWGVPQRRRRIFLVADFGGQSAPEILFKPESVRWDIAEGAAQGEGTAKGTERGAGSAGFKLGNSEYSRSIGWQFECAPTLNSECGGNKPAVYCLQGNGIDRADTAGCNGRGWKEDMSYTLNTIDRPAVVKCYDIGEARLRMPSEYVEKSPTITGRCGTGGNNVPAVAFTPSSFGGYTEGCGSLRANGGDLGGGSEALITTCYGGDDIAQTLDASYYKGVGARNGKEREIVASPQAVRRLTPLECERLQGFPDGWTAIDKATDSKRYKALGNSVAIPCVEYIMRGIKGVFDREGV